MKVARGSEAPCGERRFSTLLVCAVRFASVGICGVRGRAVLVCPGNAGLGWQRGWHGRHQRVVQRAVGWRDGGVDSVGAVWQRCGRRDGGAHHHTGCIEGHRHRVEVEALARRPSVCPCDRRTRSWERYYGCRRWRWRSGCWCRCRCDVEASARKTITCVSGPTSRVRLLAAMVRVLRRLLGLLFGSTSASASASTCTCNFHLNTGAPSRGNRREVREGQRVDHHTAIQLERLVVGRRGQ